MTFFYHSGFGMAYFIATSLVCLYAILCGSKEYRLFGYSVLGVFLADRIILAVMPDEVWLVTAAAIIEFAALTFILSHYTSRAARALACLFLLKMSCYLALLNAIVAFATMAAWLELFGYLQLLLIGGGTIAGFRNRHSNPSGGHTGRIGLLGLKARWLSAKRHS